MVLQLEAITKWTGAVPNFVSGEGSKIVPVLDITALQQKDAGYQR